MATCQSGKTFQFPVPILAEWTAIVSGRRVQHLVERGRGYQLRIPVPVDLQALLGRKELRWSVQTRDPSVAKDRVLEATLAFRRFCDKLRSMKKLSVDDAREIARAFYQNLADSYRSPAPIPDDAPPYVLDQQQEMAEEEIGRPQNQAQRLLGRSVRAWRGQR